MSLASVVIDSAAVLLAAIMTGFWVRVASSIRERRDQEICAEVSAWLVVVVDRATGIGPVLEVARTS